MSYAYRQNSQASPYAYGYTASSCQQPNLSETQGMETNIPKIGEQYGTGSPSAMKNQNDTLNFGWFSLPRAKQGSAPGEDQLKSPGAAGGEPDNSTGPESNQRPLSKEGLRPDSQQRTISQQGKQHPSSGGSPRPDSQRQELQQCMGEPADRCEADQAGFEHKEQNYCQKYYNQPMHEENVIVDWPMSVIANIQIPKPQNTSPLPVKPRTPAARSEIQEVPPTPLPPLQWQGYQNCSRPTYATWRENWHHNLQPTTASNYINNTNNNNCCKGTENHGNNTNNSNNSDVDQSLTGKECSSSNTLSGVSNYSADGNNNNWLIADGPSPRAQIRTLPPYGQSSEAVPKFYSPSMVMKWEDTDDQPNSNKEQQNLKQMSLMKRIRTSFFQMWSTLFCLKNKEDEDATQKSRLFKYDRFDNYDKSKRHAERTGDHA